MAPPVIVALQGVGRCLGTTAQAEGRWVLSGIDMALHEGEFICLVGPSGSGKTTLMRLVAGLDKPDRGQRLILAGEPRIAMVFQEPRLVPWLTALDNLLLVANRVTAEVRARDLLQMMELQDHTDDYPGQLSGGMQRRLALARALLIEPDLLLLDEPLVSLDPALEERMGEVLYRYWQAHQPGVLMVTHDPRQAARFATRLIGLGAGENGLVLDENLTEPIPGKRSSHDEAMILRRLFTGHPTLSIAS
ncbi:MAG TPA: ATP-binding cassette domain-containing protein [Terriglobales bacterium]|nr:ATP-binding cassette domain-containing protein [Terriglobales bacterium]